jgi:hypothetical protein
MYFEDSYIINKINTKLVSTMERRFFKHHLVNSGTPFIESYIDKSLLKNNTC